MSVLHISWSSKPIIGGIEAYLDRVLRCLPEWTAGILSGTPCDDHGYYYLPELARGNAFDLDAFARFVAPLLGRLSVCHFHNMHMIGPDKTLQMFAWLRRHTRLQLVHSVHVAGVFPGTREVMALPFDGFMVYSEWLGEYVERTFGVGAVVLPLLVDLPSVSAPAGVPAPVTVLQPTRFARDKGSYESLQAIRELLDGGYDLTFTQAGADPARLLLDDAWVPPEITPYLRAGRVCLTTYSYQEVLDALVRCDIVLHPSYGGTAEGEAFGSACLQALAAGKAVIASSSGHLPRLLAGYGRKTIIEPGNVPALKRALKQWLDDGIPPLTPLDFAVIGAWREHFEQAPERHRAYYRLLGGNAAGQGPGSNVSR